MSFVEGNTRILQAARNAPETPASKDLAGIWTSEKAVEVAGRIYIPPLGISREELNKIEEESNPVFYVPEQVTLEMLDRMFPDMKMDPWIHQKIRLDDSHIGWRRTATREYESEIDGMDLREFIIRGIYVKQRTHKFPDEDNLAFLAGSSDKKRALYAGFRNNGSLMVYRQLRTGMHFPNITDIYSEPV